MIKAEKNIKMKQIFQILLNQILFFLEKSSKKKKIWKLYIDYKRIPSKLQIVKCKIKFEEGWLHRQIK
jgi:hypothetical protein